MCHVYVKFVAKGLRYFSEKIINEFTISFSQMKKLKIFYVLLNFDEFVQ